MTNATSQSSIARRQARDTGQTKYEGKRCKQCRGTVRCLLQLLLRQVGAQAGGGASMTRRCLESQHNHRATQRDHHARQIIRRRIKGKMIGSEPGACEAWWWRNYRGWWRLLRMSAGMQFRRLKSVRQPRP